MKTHALRPARAACAATAFARLPVEAQPIVSSPKAAAAVAVCRTAQGLSSRGSLHGARRLALASGADQRLIGGIERIAVLGTRECSTPHVARVVPEGALDDGTDLGVALHETGRDVADEVAE